MTAETAELLGVETPDAAQNDPQDAPEKAEPDAPKDVEVILPPPGEVVIQGVKCEVRRLRMREFFALMGIITNGLGGAVGQMGWGNTRDREEFGQLLMAAFIMAIPNQVPQFITFVQTIVEPQGDKSQVRMVQAYLENPEIEDMLPVVDAIVMNEKDNLRELVGKAQAYMARWQTVFDRPAVP